MDKIYTNVLNRKSYDGFFERFLKKLVEFACGIWVNSYSFIISVQTWNNTEIPSLISRLLKALVNAILGVVNLIIKYENGSLINSSCIIRNVFQKYERSNQKLADDILLSFIAELTSCDISEDSTEFTYHIGTELGCHLADEFCLEHEIQTILGL